MLRHQTFKNISTLLRLLRFKQTLSMMDLYLNDLVRFQTLSGSAHDLADRKTVGDHMACSFVLRHHFEETDVGLSIFVELFEGFLTELYSNFPVFLLIQNFHDSKVDNSSHIALNSFFDSFLEPTKDQLSIEP